MRWKFDEEKYAMNKNEMKWNRRRLAFEMNFYEIFSMRNGKCVYVAIDGVWTELERHDCDVLRCLPKIKMAVRVKSEQTRPIRHTVDVSWIRIGCDSLYNRTARSMKKKKEQQRHIHTHSRGRCTYAWAHTYTSSESRVRARERERERHIKTRRE